MVSTAQAQRAASILRAIESEQKGLNPCPRCNSRNIELVSTPRKASNWVSALFGLFISGYAIPIDKVFHCFDCGHEFPTTENGNAEEVVNK